jgi:LPPG:FO 2-phospho-L-lactate transferase
VAGVITVEPTRVESLSLPGKTGGQETKSLVALAGGVGGAKLADGLARILPPNRLTVIVNTADDFELYGLHISPDLDTVTYTLAGVANAETGWGLTGETWHAFEQLQRLGTEPWFRLGDRDLAIHLWRTQALRDGATLTQFTVQLCQALGVGPTILPMTNDPVRTLVETDDGELAFQDYFVRRQWQPVVRGLRFVGAETATPTTEVLAALDAADLVVICPSNPWLSIDPILAVPGIRVRLAGKPVFAVTPIVGGQALRGPAAKLMCELGIEPTPVAVAEHYRDFLTGFVLDQVDADLEPQVAASGVRTLVTDTVMWTPDDRARLAREVLAFGTRL